MPSLVQFGHAVGPRRPPQNGQLTCFDQWSKRYRADLTTPNPAQTLGNVLTLKTRGLKWHFRRRAPALCPFACGIDSMRRGSRPECSSGMKRCFRLKTAQRAPPGLPYTYAEFGTIWTRRWAAPTPPKRPVDVF